WPACTDPRTSVLWRRVGSTWCCAGLLIESPEPIHRPGRLEVLDLSYRSAGVITPFEIRHWDRIGCRLMFARNESSPTVGSPPPDAFVLTASDKRENNTLTGYLRIASAPLFIREAP